MEVNEIIMKFIDSYIKLKKRLTNIFIIIFVIVGLAFVFWDRLKPDPKNSNTSFVTLSKSTQDKIIINYVNVLDSFAMAMPIIGGDTESDWAADTVHYMAQQVRESDKPYIDKLADIYLMYDYIAYGFSYFNAIIGVNGENSDMCKYALWQMLHVSDSLYHSFISDEQKKVNILAKFSFQSTHHMQLFYSLVAANNNFSYKDPDLFFSLQCAQVVDSLNKVSEFDEAGLFKIYSFLESSAFFKMIFPLMRLFDNPSGLSTENNSLIMEAAAFFDEKTVPVFNYITQGDKMSLPNDKDFEEYLIKATNYKIALLRLTTQEMLSQKK